MVMPFVRWDHVRLVLVAVRTRLVPAHTERAGGLRPRCFRPQGLNSQLQLVATLGVQSSGLSGTAAPPRPFPQTGFQAGGAGANRRRDLRAGLAVLLGHRE